MPFRTLAGAGVHVFTSLGAVCGVLALDAAASEQLPAAFAWLGVAAIIDGADGPIARRLDVERTLPRFSGVRLDLVVDYLTYCVVPAFIVMQSGIAGRAGGIIVASAIVLSSLFHFADTRSKTEDGFFVGFPAIWNVVVFYFFVFGAGPLWTMCVTLFLTAATFVPIKWIHPLRVMRWRPMTLVAMLIWSAAAIYEVIENFPGITLTSAALGITAAYFVLLGVGRSMDLRRGS